MNSTKALLLSSVIVNLLWGAFLAEAGGHIAKASAD